MRTKIYLSCMAIFFTTVSCSNSQNSGEDNFYQLRTSMVQHQIRDRGIRNDRVLKALMEVPRHKFVPDEYKRHSYDDSALPVGYNQTISQPYVVAFMTEILNPGSNQKVLEIGTGSGYQAAILSKLYKEVYTIEIIKPLGERAKKVLDEENCKNVNVRIGDGYQGWKEHAPFDAIIVTCAPEDVPAPLVEQLAEGGKMIIPVGDSFRQDLYLLEKKEGKISRTQTLPVMFVPMQRED